MIALLRRVRRLLWVAGIAVFALVAGESSHGEAWAVAASLMG
ncbi:hypothetical protein [Hyphomicrobium sp.]|nr:hypothetical protein [Hyphomicrobium sp.]